MSRKKNQSHTNNIEQRNVKRVLRTETSNFEKQAFWSVTNSNQKLYQVPETFMEHN
jgi:hypothetical protein